MKFYQLPLGFVMLLLLGYVNQTHKYLKLYVNMSENLTPDDLKILNTTNNSIDNTQGDWTFIPSEEHIYVVNNKNNKKYKINLTEVS